MAGTTVSLRYWPVAPVPPPRTSILVALEPITSTFPLLITPPVVVRYIPPRLEPWTRCKQANAIRAGPCRPQWTVLSSTNSPTPCLCRRTFPLEGAPVVKRQDIQGLAVAECHAFTPAELRQG